MNRYEILVFLHVLAAIVWLGSAFFVQVLVYRWERVGDRAALKALADSAEWMAQRLFIPASLLLLLLGVALVLDGPWQFSDLWVVIGLLGYAASFLVGLLLITPEGPRVAAAMAANDHAEAARRIRRINVISRVELALLFLVVADMVLKPTGDDTGTVALLALLAAAAVALGVWTLRADTRPASAAG